ncbi:uncharacterized N-acetyltransferase YobR [Arthrobacter sp. Hiyo4]|nr:uncharacterized N-acetyltransferase YobR [Arthrobacter sp. Hiyo4]
MDAAWPAPDREESDGWVLRAASGVTQRANSVWPREPEGDTSRQHEALRAARLWYRGRRLPLIFQVFDDPRSAGLNAILDGEGFTRQSETLVMCRSSGTRPEVTHPAVAGSGVEISTVPSNEWLELWWSVDGRGGPAERSTARTILAGCPSLYALVRSDDGVPAAVGRLAVPTAGEAGGIWGGLYCMATRRKPAGAATPFGSCRHSCTKAPPATWPATGCWSPQRTPGPGSSTPRRDSRRPAATSTGRNGPSGT